MEKTLIIWNDLSIFGLNGKAIDSIIGKIDKFKIKNINYIYINSETTFCWKSSISNLHNGNTIFIGSRPNYCFNNNLRNALELNPQRTHNENGYTENIDFTKKDTSQLTKFVLKTKNKEIRIIEDIIITGKTMEAILKTIYSTGYSGIITIDVFICNSVAKNNLICQFKDKKIKIIEHILSEGIPIKEMTCICLYDFMYNTLNGLPYCENIDLLKKYFNRSSELQNLANIFKKEIKNDIKN